MIKIDLGDGTPPTPARAQSEVIEIICYRIASGETLTRICSELGMPDRKTVRAWRLADAAIDAAFHVAIQDQADFFAEQMLIVARAAYDLPKDSIQAAKLEMDALKWLAAQQSPKKWGPRQQIDLSAQMDVRQMSDKELHEAMIKAHADLEASLARK